MQDNADEINADEINADEIIRILESDTSIDEIIIVESENVREFTEKLNILKDKNHRIVDDCIGATVGGANNYLRILKSVSDAGTYLFTPMYSKGWKKLLQLDKLHRDPSKALELMKKTHEMSVTKGLQRLTQGLNTPKILMLLSGNLQNYLISKSSNSMTETRKSLRIVMTNSNWK